MIISYLGFFLIVSQ